MTRVIIWPDIYKEQGHWLPCVTLAKSLKDVGCTVEFMGIADCESIVAPYKATYHKIFQDIYPPTYSLENRLEPLDMRWKPHHLLPICEGVLDPIFSGATDTLLISGYFTGLETLLISHKYKIPFVTITTYLRHPADTPAMHAKTKLVYMPPAFAQKLINSVTNESNMSIDDFVNRMRQPERIRDSDPPMSSPPSPRICPLEVIPCPQELDFEDDDYVHGAYVHYVEPMVKRATLDGSSLPSNPDNLPLGKPIIYGCVGSQVQDYQTKATEFFRNLIYMMHAEGMDAYNLVLAVGPRLLAAFTEEFSKPGEPGTSTLPSNVYLYDWVSQPEVLNQAEMAFVHGGLATIKEAIANSKVPAGGTTPVAHPVPLVIVPQGKDQLDNSLRLSRKGLAMVAQVEDTSSLGLRKLVTAVCADRRIAKNLTDMWALFKAAEDAKASVPLITAKMAP